MLKASFSSRRNGDREVFFWSLRFEITTYFDVPFFWYNHNFLFWPTFQSELLLELANHWCYGRIILVMVMMVLNLRMIAVIMHRYVRYYFQYYTAED